MKLNIKNILRTLWQNEDGFTLLEAILSIATLALISGFILQMFIVSAEANTKARMIDMASAEAQTIIETIKGFDSLEAFYTSGIAVPEQEDGDICYRWYDKNWKPVTDDSLSYYGDLVNPGSSYPADAVYALQIKATEEMDIPNRQLVTAVSFSSETGQSQPVHAGDMISIDILAISLKAPEGKRELAAYSTQKYFPFYTSE